MISYGEGDVFYSFFLFLIRLALTANRIVERVSPTSDRSEEHVVIMLVLDSPLSESFNILVSLELR